MRTPPSLEQVFTLGLASASALLGEKTGGQLTLRSVRVRPLADFSDVSEADQTDVVAGVAQRFSGALRGTSLFTMEPKGALAWSRSVVGPKSEPERVITAFVELAGHVLSDLIGTAAQAMHGGQPDFDAASLREDSRVAIVIATHAPSDTVIATLDLEVEFDGVSHAAHVDLLLEPKLLSAHWTDDSSPL